MIEKIELDTDEVNRSNKIRPCDNSICRNWSHEGCKRSKCEWGEGVMSDNLRTRPFPSVIAQTKRIDKLLNRTIKLGTPMPIALEMIADGIESLKKSFINEDLINKIMTIIENNVEEWDSVDSDLNEVNNIKIDLQKIRKDLQELGV